MFLSEFEQGVKHGMKLARKRQVILSWTASFVLVYLAALAAFATVYVCVTYFS